MRDGEGAIGAIDNGTIQRAIEARAYEVQRAIDNGTRPWVGVNVHQTGADQANDMATWEPDTEVLDRRSRSVQAVRSERSEHEVAAALSDLGTVCRSPESVMPAMIRAVEAYATVGEIAGVMREAFGSFVEPTIA